MIRCKLRYTSLISGTAICRHGALSRRVCRAENLEQRALLNVAPVATNDEYAASDQAELRIEAPGVLANDQEVDGEAISAFLVSSPEKGSLNFQADGGFVYVPLPGASGLDSFEYRAFDGVLASEVATVTFSVPTGAPSIEPVGWLADAGGNGHFYAPVSDGLHWNDARVAAESLTYFGVPGHLATITSAEENQFLTDAFGAFGGWFGGYQDRSSPDYLEPNGGWQWVTGEPWSFTNWNIGEPNDSGDEDHLHQLPRWNDLNGVRFTNSFMVEFSATEQLIPMPNDDTYAVLSNAELAVSAENGLLANDRSPMGAVAAASIESGPTHGIVDLSPDGWFSYVPTTDFVGRDSFTYRVTIADALSAVATVWIGVGVNEQPPTTSDDFYFTDEGAALNVDVASGRPGVAEAFDDEALSPALEAPGFDVNEGVVRRVGGQNQNDYAYLRTVNSDLLGEDFIYEVSFSTSWGVFPESNSNQSLNLIGIGAGDFKLGFANHEPIDSLFLRIRSPGVDGGSIFVSNSPLNDLAPLGSIPTGGNHRARIEKIGDRVTFSVDAHFDGVFQADMSHTFDDLATVAPFLTDTNTRAFVGAALAKESFDDIRLTFLPQTGVLANDSDDEQAPLSASVLTEPQHGALTLNADGTFEYVPAPGFSGIDTFTYLASDGQLESVGQATIAVRDVPEPAIAVDDQYELTQEGLQNVGSPLDALRTVALPHGWRDIVYDPVGGKFHISVHNVALPFAGTVVSLDPATGELSEPLVVGNKPNQLAVSDDGHYLYVGLDGSNSIRRVDLTTGVAGPSASLGDVFAGDIEVFPGHPGSIAVALSRRDNHPDVAGAAIFDDMIRRPGTLGTLENSFDFNDEGTGAVSFLS